MVWAFLLLLAWVLLFIGFRVYRWKVAEAYRRGREDGVREWHRFREQEVASELRASKGIVFSAPFYMEGDSNGTLCFDEGSKEWRKREGGG